MARYGPWPACSQEFLLSEGGVQASEAATEVHNSRAKEEALLERVRQVFEAKCVIKICMNEKVAEGAMRLLDHAEVIKQAVDLRGSCIALDDCYEVRPPTWLLLADLQGPAYRYRADSGAFNPLL